MDEKFELVKPCSVVLSSTEDSKRSEKSYLGSQGQGRRELETLSSLSSDPSDPKEIPPLPQPSLPHVTASGSEALKEYAQPSGKPHRRGLLPSSVKKEDSKEQADLPPLAPPSSQSLSETSPRPAKLQEGTDSKKVLQFPSLHTTTNVSWCYLNYIKPNHIQHADRRSSVYAGWCISLYNPNLPGVSTKAALSLLRSKQKVSKETYTMATAPHPETGRLVPSSSRKPRMTEVSSVLFFFYSLIVKAFAELLKPHSPQGPFAKREPTEWTDFLSISCDWPPYLLDFFVSVPQIIGLDAFQ